MHGAPNRMRKKTDLRMLDEQGLAEFVREAGLPAYRARQLTHWLYDRLAREISEITEFSKALRDDLSEVAYIGNLALVERLQSGDGTEKYLFGLEDGHAVESVLIPDADRMTLCISSQVGCAMGCAFCRTARMGLVRNLRAHEIVAQVIEAMRMVGEGGRVTNIVMMGMGEPLNNVPEVVRALSTLAGPLGFSRRRITVSTSGLVPAMAELPRLLKRGMDMYVNLAVSLNATTDEIRSAIMPVNRRWPLAELMEACRRYPLPPGRRITFEYVMLGGVNDTDADAERLVRLLADIPAKVNLIPFNPFEGSGFSRPPDERVDAFQQRLMSAGLTAFVRKSKGGDILASCGQLMSNR